MKITILEHMGENNCWEWYDIFKRTVATPKQAIKKYLDEHMLDPEKIIQEGDTFYAEHTDVRAFEYTI